jgi:hypothetical protein
VRDDADLLEQLAVEHRDLTTRSRRLRRESETDELWRLARDVVEHELAHRLLVHPLLRRDDRGLSLFEERREEQLLLADRLGHTLAASEPRARARAIADFDAEFAAHTDREEILSIPHLRREVAALELRELGAVRQELRPLVLAGLASDPRSVTHGRWSTVPRHELAGLLGLPPALTSRFPLATAGRAVELTDRELEDAARD